MKTVQRIQFNFKCKDGVVSLLKAIAADLGVPVFALSEYILAHGVAEVVTKTENEKGRESLTKQLYENHIWVKEK